MLEHVLVPLDGSQLAQIALDYALHLLGKNGKITLLTILQQPEVSIYDFYPLAVKAPVKDYEAAFSETLSYAQDYLKRVAADIRDRYPYEVNTEVEAGDPATLIVETAQRLHVDAIVMSTHGRSGISRWLFGSVTQKVLSAGNLPVFVIPARVREETKTPEIVEQTHPQAT
jgi:nucleotide-binding universal stress UspA family protein